MENETVFLLYKILKNRILSEILYKSKKGIDAIHENVQATLGPIENNLKLKNMLEKAFNLPQIPILPNTIAENSNVLILQKVVTVYIYCILIYSYHFNLNLFFLLIQILIVLIKYNQKYYLKQLKNYQVQN